MTPLQAQGAAAKAASRELAVAGTAKKNEALEAIARILTERQEEWLAANADAAHHAHRGRAVTIAVVIHGIHLNVPLNNI